MKTILIVILITCGFVFYLFQHRVSIDLTGIIMKQEKEKQLLNEEIIALESNCAKIFLFTNLEKIAQNLNLIYNKNNNQFSQIPPPNNHLAVTEYQNKPQSDQHATY